MTRTQKKFITFDQDPSSPVQLPLRARGLHVHDARSQYPPLPLSPLSDIATIGKRCANWANGHPACDDRVDVELMNRISFTASMAGRSYCNVTQEDLVNHLYAALAIRLSTKTIQRRLRRLEAVGAIRIKVRYDRKTRKTTNRYHLPAQKNE